MNCPKCGKEMRTGFVEAKSAGSLTQAFTQVTWYPEEYKGKFIKREPVTLSLQAEGQYCDFMLYFFRYSPGVVWNSSWNMRRKSL